MCFCKYGANNDTYIVISKQLLWMTCSYRPIKRVDNGHEVAKDKKELIVHPIISKKVAL